MSRGVTVARRLTRPDGAPTALARAGVAVLMAAAAAAGWAAGPDRDDPGERSRDVVAVFELSGDLPTPRAAVRPELGSAAALPAIRAALPPARAQSPEPVATPSPTAAPAASPDATATPEITVVPVASPPPAPVPTAAPPEPAATPAPTFDTSG